MLASPKLVSFSEKHQKRPVNPVCSLLLLGFLVLSAQAFNPRITATNAINFITEDQHHGFGDKQSNNNPKKVRSTNRQQQRVWQNGRQKLQMAEEAFFLLGGWELWLDKDWMKS